MFEENTQQNFISLNTALRLVKADTDFQMQQLLTGRQVDKHTFVLYSLPGIGKTQGIRELVQDQQELCIIDINAEFGGSLAMPISHVNEQEQTAQVLHALNASIARLRRHALSAPQTAHFLFLDEFNRGDEFMKQTIMQLLLENRLPGNPLPANIFVVGAGNTAENIFSDEQTVENDVNELDTATRDRINPLFIQLEPKEWLDWAYQNEVAPEVVDFIGSKSYNEQRDLLYQPSKSADGTGATPRSWTRLSSFLADPVIKNDPVLLKAAIFSMIGNDCGNRFLTYLTTGDPLDIFALLREPDQAKFAALATGSKMAFFSSALRPVEQDLTSTRPRGYAEIFTKYLQTDDQTAVARFMHTQVETGVLQERYPLTNEYLRQQPVFMQLVMEMSVNNI
ncbi:ATPase [Ligilactobacillus salitolerans]|uniref:ATPase n=1 Tax=Ligilactobacillus salitolerans TaxID=1808352 RepID=A0A401IRZ6_9LACO|nr:ATPase [Ligilactobacillus salitolerans]GBG94275.1 ATPase [Ligilactobacillus salitolerans]